MAVSSQWEFQYVEQSTQMGDGHHILDDIVELQPLDEDKTSPVEESATNTIVETKPKEIIDISADTAKSDLNQTEISDSSHTTFKSTVSKGSPLKTSRKRKRDIPSRERTLDDSIITISSHSSGSSNGSQAVSTTRSCPSKRRRLSHREKKHHRLQDSFLSQQSYPSNSQLSDSVPFTSRSQRDILTFNSDILSNEVESQPLHDLRWPCHIYTGNKSIAIRLKGVYHPASIEYVTRDSFVVKVKTPKTGTIRAVRFRYDDFQRDPLRVIAMVNASELTQTQSQHARCSQYNQWTVNPMECLETSIEFNPHSLSERDIPSIPDVLGLNLGNERERSIETDDEEEIDENEPILSIPVDDDEENNQIHLNVSEQDIDSNANDNNLQNENERNPEIKEDEHDDGHSKQEADSIHDSSFPTTKVVQISYRKSRSRRRRSLRQKPIRGYFVRTEAVPESTSNTNNVQSLDDVGIGRFESGEQGIDEVQSDENEPIMQPVDEQKSEVSSKKKRNGGKKKKAAKTEWTTKSRRWTKEEENALVRAYKKHRRHESAPRFKPGVFSHIVKDEEFSEIFANRTRQVLKCKWSRFNGKMKWTQKWDQEESERNDNQDSGGKSEDDASD